MKIFPILAALTFGATGMANAQVDGGYGQQQGTSERSGYGQQQGTSERSGYGQQGTPGGSGYGTSGTGQGPKYERTERAQELDGDGRDGRRLPYEGGGYGGYGVPPGAENLDEYAGVPPSPREDDMYDYSGVDGTGPKIKGRY